MSEDNSLINLEKSLDIPKHVAIIMDGNGRWAQKRGLTRVVGHKNGVSNVRKVVKHAKSLGVEILTLFAFSSENWGRPKSEISVIMSLIDQFIKKDCQTLDEQNIRLKVIGDLSLLPRSTYKLIKEAEETLSGNTGMILNVALSYSGREDIVHACKSLAHKAKDGKISPEEINESMVAGELSTGSLPDPDLLIRTSGEQRLSNFLLWQFAYTELYFTDVLWPDFKEDDFEKAIASYSRRNRRFGLVDSYNENVSNISTS